MRFIVTVMISLVLASCGKDEPRALQPPASVVAVEDIGAVTVQWSPVAGATSYNVRYSTDPNLDSFSSVQTDSSVTSATISYLTNVPYYFAVTVTYGDRNSAPSKIVSVTPLRVSQVIGGNHVDSATGVTNDSSGNILITGSSSSYPFDGTYAAGGKFAFVTKRTPRGDRLWTTTVGREITSALAISTGPADEVYITGYTSADLDGVHIGWSDLFIAKLDAEGNLKWLHQLGVTGASTQGMGISVDGAGNAYVTGTTSGDLLGIIRAGNTDMFVAKYARNGERQWVRLYGSSGSIVSGQHIAVTSAGFAVTGSTSGFFYGERNSISPIYVMMCDIDGNRIWSHTIGTGLTTEVAGVAVAANGDLYVAGYTNGSFMATPKNGQNDTFLSKFRADGTYRWTVTSGVAGRYKNASGITISTLGDIFVTGTLTNSQGLNNMFLDRYSLEGEKIWSVVRAPDSTVAISGITASLGHVYVTGILYSQLFENNQGIGYDDVILAGFNSDYGCY
ncbi:MAG: SBBP repeat-containing protein [Pelobacteraceae bacterium]